MHPTPPAGPLALCYGTRPQVIKASALVPALASAFDLLTVDTGQHYDYELNALLYQQLGLAPPDLFLEVGSGDHATQTAAVLTRASRCLEERRPWAVVVIGDTNSTLGCALAAVKLRIPVVHVEAGLRGPDPMMAEEINRRVVDAVSAVLFAPSERAGARLWGEGGLGLVRVVGDIARDALELAVPRLNPIHTAAEWPLPPSQRYVFATVHRAELADDRSRLSSVIRSLGAIGETGLPVVLAAHPRTRAALERFSLDGAHAALHVIGALGYLESLAAIRSAEIVITDSGGIQREAYWLGRPCVTLRDETEWVETVEAGANHLVPPAEAHRLTEAVFAALADSDDDGGGSRRGPWSPTAYGDGRTARRIRDTLLEWREGRRVHSSDAGRVAQ